jgi:hypothetical protein
VTEVRILLDEHVGRIFERVLDERGFEVEQAKDRFGETTEDRQLLRWCADNGVVLLTNNAKDFETLHQRHDHHGLLLYREQTLPDTDPEGLARAVEEVFDQYGASGVENELVELRGWYEWLQG